MSDTRVAIYDDDRGRWGPLTDRRPAFELRTGAVTSRERIERALGVAAAALIVPARLAAVVAERELGLSVNAPLTGGDWLVVNGRWNGLDAEVTEGVRTLKRGEGLVQADGTPVAAHLAADDAQRFGDAQMREPPASAAGHALERNVLLDRPWHILDGLDAALRSDLDASTLARRESIMQTTGDHPVRVADDANVLPGVIFDSAHGPVVIDRHARVDPCAVLQGPCLVGAHSHVAAHAWLRSGTSIGPHCKVGGEVKHSVIHGHTNKAHLGYLGDSIVGEWTNLGADTNVSNLKNTYGPVRVQLEPDARAEDTGRTNHGPIIGDFVRTAIGTRLLTGSVVGTGAMLALSTLAPKHVDRLSFCTDAAVTHHDLDALLATATRMMALHDVELTKAEADVLRALHRRATARVA